MSVLSNNPTVNTMSIHCLSFFLLNFLPHLLLLPLHHYHLLLFLLQPLHEVIHWVLITKAHYPRADTNTPPPPPRPTHTHKNPFDLSFQTTKNKNKKWRSNLFNHHSFIIEKKLNFNSSRVSFFVCYLQYKLYKFYTLSGDFICTACVAPNHLTNSVAMIFFSEIFFCNVIFI